MTDNFDVINLILSSFLLQWFIIVLSTFILIGQARRLMNNI